jgi:hypothetical protein
MALTMRLCWCLGLLTLGAGAALSQPADAVSEQLRRHQYDLAAEGKSFLLREAGRAGFFLLGELHGENEIPALLRDLWPSMWQAGYRHIAAELSPWMATHLEFPGPASEPRAGSWTTVEAAFVASLRKSGGPVLWGCDMEEIRPHLLIRDLAAANPKNQDLRAMVEMTKSGYRRNQAPDLLTLLRQASGVKDASLRLNIERTLEIDIDRLSPNTRFEASFRRETLMKELFLAHYRETSKGSPKTKVMARFGRNHLHRGYDHRGISTLGNFIAELGTVEGVPSFHLAVFAAGGKIFYQSALLAADERFDDPAFDLLASLARAPATVFDLRPLRSALHRLPEKERSPALASLIYWSDSYDAILCYREVTPLQP